MKTNKQLVNHLIETGVLKTPAIISAFQKVERIHFFKEKSRDLVYDDNAYSIGFGQTISQPFTVAFMLELLQPQKGDNILDVGSGSGWTTALLASIVGKRGRVTGVEIIPELVDYGQKNLKIFGFSNAEIVIGKIGELGLPGKKFNKILVSAAATMLPKNLVDQLEIDGRLVIPINNSIYKIDKLSGKEIKTQEFEGFVFVPLIT